MVGGVASGVARRIGRDPTIVRVVLLLCGLASGFGLLIYVLAWLLLPSESNSENIMKRAAHDSRGILLCLGILPFVIVLLLIGQAVASPLRGNFAVPILVSPLVLILIWRNGDPADRAIFERVARPLRDLGQPQGGGVLNRLIVRAIAALALVGVGLWFLLDRVNTKKGSVSYRPIEGLLLLLAASVVFLGPWWLRVARDLMLERQARARAEERADVAARVHDSVLQTLALIQRRADQPQQVIQLARAQERELRSWLFDGDLLLGGEDTTFSSAIRRIQSDVEALHGLPVEVVVVGDCALDERLRAMLAAAREALVNAAKWSEAMSLSLFGEIEGHTVSVFVRDRGVGFDPDAIAPDRKGIAESIRGRMARHGGEVSIRSSPGAGTEVELSMTISPELLGARKGSAPA